MLLVLVSSSVFAGDDGWTSFIDYEGQIKVPVSINGFEGFAILDTGATHSSINESFVVKNKINFTKGGKVRITGVSGRLTTHYFKDINVSLLGKLVKFKKMSSSKLNENQRTVLIGMDFLHNFIIKIDYPNNRLRFINRDDMDLKENKNVTADFNDSMNGLIVNVGIEKNKVLKLLLDTGNAGGILLDRKVANRYGLLDRYPIEDGIGRGVVRTIKLKQFSVSDVQFGPYTLDNVVMRVPAVGEPYLVSDLYSAYDRGNRRKRIDGLLGYDVLKRFVLTIDYKTRYVHIEMPD